MIRINPKNLFSEIHKSRLILESVLQEEKEKQWGQQQIE